MTSADIAVGEHRNLLDIIDSLRSQGVSHYVDLPEIIVCGDQSAGKSSVLEALSGVSFPTMDGLCTRFATELILRRGPVLTKISIIPGESRFGDDIDRLGSWQPTASIDGKEGLRAVTDEAKRAMAEPPRACEFYDDILRIELRGPDQPHLTMVDLPGLFRTGNKEQSDEDAGIVHDMVERYMARPRSIILTVVSAKYSFVLQEVTRMAKQADPEGLRTLGLITQPDTLDVGSSSESYFVRLAQNQEEELRLGWHVLKNRSFEERHVTSTERDAIESKFLGQGLWGAIEPSHRGVAALRVRLSTVLKDQILTQLPTLVQDVEDGLRDCTERLERLGPVRGTPQEHLSYLLQISEEYTSLMTQAVDGSYTDRFFGKQYSMEKFYRRLRAVVRKRLREFASEMLVNGQKEDIVDSENEEEGDDDIRDVPRITRSDYVERVAKLLTYSEGRELPGLFNPLIVNELFVEQCEPWKRIARQVAEDILEAANLSIGFIVEQIAPVDVAGRILQFIHQETDKLKAKMDDIVNKLLASAMQHQITYDTRLIENVQRIQQARRQRMNKKLVGKTFGSQRFDSPESKISINPIQFMSLLEEGFESNMEQFASALAVDYMKAYYKVAMTRFIDDVSTLAVEDCLISRLPTLLRSSDVLKMSEADIARLAGETDSSSAERRRLEEKQKILRLGLQGLRGLYKRRSPLNNLRHDQASVGESAKTSITVVTSTSDDAPAAVVSTEKPDPTVIPDDVYNAPESGEVPPSVDEWMNRHEVGDTVEDTWNPPVSSKEKKKKKKISKQIRDEDFSSS